MQRFIAFTLALASSGCLAAQLRGPATDHHLQTRAIVERCEGAYYDGECSPDLIEDVTAMCDQAEAIRAAAEGREPESCKTSDDATPAAVEEPDQ